MKLTTLSLVFAFLGAACSGALASRFGIRIETGQIKFDDHIHFGSDSDEILPESNELLDALAQTLNEHPEITALRVDGHTDATGDDAHNMDLSERRAASVAAALTERGVQAQIQSRGLGETMPLCQEQTDACNQRNRRVELHIL